MCSSPENVVTFAAGANGDVSPIATLGGLFTGLDTPVSMAVDGSGKIYVATSYGDPTTGPSIVTYAAGATGSVYPTSIIAGNGTGLNNPLGVAVDGAGKIYAANFAGNSITVYAAGATGNTAPIATISGGSTWLDTPLGLALQP